MSKPQTPVNIDSATLVNPTRWHLPRERMRVTTGDRAIPLEDALREERAVLAPDSTPPIGDPEVALAHLGSADPRLLLMSLVHLTGDESLLDRFAPYITAQVAGGAKGVANSGMPDEARAEIRQRLVDMLSQDGIAAEVPVSARLFQKMASVCAGERVGDEFLPMLLEQAGFTGTQGVDPSARARPPEHFKILVVGAGLSGIALGAKLGELGYDYQIIERHAEVGGTWWVNRYPGVGVDTPSHYYSYSYLLNPDWPKFFSRGSDLVDYLKRAADHLGVRERIEFETEVVSATFDEECGRWRIRVRDKQGGEKDVVADVFIPAINFTNAPFIPALKGLDRFQGPAMHTAEWDESVDLRGKRVAVIGTGASSMQLCTTIAPTVEHLTVFQRSRHWIVPAPLVGVEVPQGARWAMRHIPHYAQWQRFITYWTSSDNIYPVAVMDPDWTMNDVSISAPNERRRQLLTDYIHKELDGRPDLIAKCIPDYPPMGKRIILDAGWYKMLRRDNVDLDDTGVAEITEDAVITRDGRRVPLDVIVLSTGFSMRPMIPTMKIIGRGGTVLSEVWGDDPRAYLGMLVPEFPNLFVINGPNSAPTHGAGQSLTAEAATTYILGLLDLLLTSGADTVECTKEAMDSYNSALDENLERMVWNHPKASSYYLNAQRRNTMSNPWRLVDSWWMSRSPNPDDLALNRKGT